VVAELAGQAQAEAIQLALEYAPQPPFRAGTPEEAPAAVLATVRTQMAPTRAARAAIIAKLVGADIAGAA
jgi:cyclohexyl-isocyanide hydratase